MKNIMKCAVLILFLMILLLYPAPIIAATKTGFLTWAEKVIPALFPFFVLTRLMIYFQVPQMIGKCLAPIFKYLLKISPITFFIMLMSLISGNPSGPKMAREYYDKHLISEREMIGLLYFCNFASPLFIIGTIGVVLYQSSQIGYILLMSHLVGSFIVFLLCYPYFKSNETRNFSIEFPTQSFATILIDCIESSMQTLIRVGGIIVFYYIISEALQVIHVIDILDIILKPVLIRFQLHSIEPLFAGFLEFTQGVTKLTEIEAPLHIKLTLTAFIVSFTGLSVHTQSFMFSKGLNISYLKYVTLRIFHGLASAILLLISFPLLNITEDVFLPLPGENTLITSPLVNITISILLIYLALTLVRFMYQTITKRRSITY